MLCTQTLVENSPLYGREPRFYCDKADFRLFKPMNKKERERLSKYCRFISHSRYSPVLPIYSKYTHARCGDYKYSISQPNWSFFQYLSNTIGKRTIHFQRMEFAADWTAETQEEADEMLIWVLEHIGIKWRGQARRKLNKLNGKRDGLVWNYEGNTWYLDMYRANFNLVMYSDKPCRFTGSPCFHMEIRINSGALKKYFGGEIHNINHVNVIKIYEKKLCWFFLKNLESLGKAYLNIDGRFSKKVKVIHRSKRNIKRSNYPKKIYRNDALRAGGILLRSNREEVNSITINQKLIDSDPRLQKAYITVPFFEVAKKKREY